MSPDNGRCSGAEEECGPEFLGVRKGSDTCPATDYEYYEAAQYEALIRFRDAGKPIEMWVFPDEKHSLFHPAHIHTEFRRNIQWFSYWLQGTELVDPLDSDQYARWGKMRDMLHNNAPTSYCARRSSSS